MTDEVIRERLRNRFPGKQPPASRTEARLAFEQTVQPLLLALGVSCTLIESYTVARRCDAIGANGQRFIVFDHAQLESFGLLEQLCTIAQPDFAAAALQRVFAEASRGAGHAAFYRFFLNRAIEIAPAIQRLSSRETAEPFIYWQTLFILLHEAAHALPPDHGLRENLMYQARLMASAMMNEQIARTSGKLREALREIIDEPPLDLTPFEEAWNATRDDLNLGDQVISDVFYSVATDPRFLDEIACDCFAISCLKTALLEQRGEVDSGSSNASELSILSSVYRGFLHLRLLGYIDEVARQMDVHLAEDRLNPLKIKQLVEVGFRGNLVVRQLLEVGKELGGESFSSQLKIMISDDQATHTDRLFTAANGLLDMTILSQAFHDNLIDLLVQDGVNVVLLNDDPFTVIHETDAAWKQLVG